MHIVNTMLMYVNSPWAHYSECSFTLRGHAFENHLTLSA